MAMLNRIDKTSLHIDEDVSREVLRHLLQQKGILLPTASAILRFKNPDNYQIIDHRTYRMLTGSKLVYDVKNKELQITIYLDYLKKLREASELFGFRFSDADRLLYMLERSGSRKQLQRDAPADQV